MCTAVTYKTKDFYFGRTLDYEFSYGEEITVTPRNYIFDFRHIGQLKSQLPAAQLHWIIADKDEAITVESMKDGLHIYDNPVGVLTNNPPFDMQMFALNNYAGLSSRQPDNTFADKLKLNAYSRGMGAMGLPGDLSSQSRFIRAAFTKLNAISSDTE